MKKTSNVCLATLVVAAGLLVGCGKESVNDEANVSVSGNDSETVLNNESIESEQVDEESLEDLEGENEGVHPTEGIPEEEIDQSLQEAEDDSLDGPVEVNDLGFLKMMMNYKSDFFVVVSSKTCGDCKMYEEETLNHYTVTEVGIPLMKVEWTELSEEQKEELRELTKFGIEWTPTTFLFKKGESVEKFEESLTINQLKEAANK